MRKQQIDYSKKKIFVSHSSKDESLINLFLNHILFLGIGLSEEDVFCTSTKGADISNGDEVRDALREALKNAKVIILVISPHYKMSEVCLNEMGGAWLSDTSVVPLVVSPISYKTVGYIQEVTNVGNIQDDSTLSKLRDTVIKSCSLQPSQTVAWDSHKRCFLENLENLLEKHSFPELITNDSFEQVKSEGDKAKKDLHDLQSAYVTLSQRYEELKKVKDSSGIKEIEEKYSDKTKIQKLEEFNSKVKSALRKFSSVIGAILLSDYFEAPYEVQDWTSYKSDIDDAIRRKLIDKDDEGFPVRRSHRDIKELFSRLEELENFISSVEEDEDFYTQYEEKYNSELDCSSQDYWGEHFHFKVVF